ncbi:MAG: hypothetical protein Q4B63_04905 [Clostridium perfringens]|nr:hypothetical protein [Clostridium perfringens]
MKKKHLKRKLLLGVAGAALVAALVYDKMNKDNKTTVNTEDEVTSDEVVEVKEEE